MRGQETTTAATAGRETRSSFRKKKEKHGLALVAPHTIPSLRRRNDARNMALHRATRDDVGIPAPSTREGKELRNRNAAERKRARNPFDEMPLRG
jgi:hypothetical protein